MHLLRIQVPEFRVLKDVDLIFEKEFVPNIYPLSSLNGGGKSTLLQLIFILLHCSGVPERHQFIKNILSGFDPHNSANKKILARLELEFNGKNIELEYSIYSSSIPINLFNPKGEVNEDSMKEFIEPSDYKRLGLNESEIKEIESKISKEEARILSLKKVLNSLDDVLTNILLMIIGIHFINSKMLFQDGNFLMEL
jgi:hypothetical protein